MSFSFAHSEEITKYAFTVLESLLIRKLLKTSFIHWTVRHRAYGTNKAWKEKLHMPMWNDDFHLKNNQMFHKYLNKRRFELKTENADNYRPNFRVSHKNPAKYAAKRNKTRCLLFLHLYCAQSFYYSRNTINTQLRLGSFLSLILFSPSQLNLNSVVLQVRNV